MINHLKIKTKSMKNFAIHKRINSKVLEVQLNGEQTKEGIDFRNMSYKLSNRK